MNEMKDIKTLGELKKSGWQSRTVKDEIRQNLIKRLKAKKPIFEGIEGYDTTVIPQIINALLAKQDFILLGLRGQAKTMLLRQLYGLLDDYMPIIEGSELLEDPLQPLTSSSKDKIETLGDKCPIAWVESSFRYSEKLATPDTNVADLIGDIDPIKAASKKLSLSDEQAINFGLIPRANRGIFAINELPDLQPRIQVALLNIMQERDIQIRGFNLRMPVDVLMVFSANPEDYTNRGNIITPLKDRIDAQILTHYPKEREIGVRITQSQAWEKRDAGVKVIVPHAYREIIEQVALEARKSEYIDQKSGVSARMSISAMDAVLSSAESRALRNGESEVHLRMTDLYHMVTALTGKLELVYEGEQEGAINVAKHLIGKAVAEIFSLYFPSPAQKNRDKHLRSEYEPLIQWFASGNRVQLHEWDSQQEYYSKLNAVDGLKALVLRRLDAPTGQPEPFMDLALDAMHYHSIISKTDIDQDFEYTDMMDSLLGGLNAPDSDDEEGLY